MYIATNVRSLPSNVLGAHWYSALDLDSSPFDFIQLAEEQMTTTTKNFHDNWLIIWLQAQNILKLIWKNMAAIWANYERLVTVVAQVGKYCVQFSVCVSVI